MYYRKGLIDEGFFRYSRNPNYLGEIMIYFSFSLLVNHPIPYLIDLYVWSSLFVVNMKVKDASLKKKKGWD